MRGEANGEDRRPRGEDQEHDEDEAEERQGGEGAPHQRQQQAAQRPAARPSSGPQQPPTPPAVTRNVGYVGKHRLSAAITRLDQELQSLQIELNELETMEPASTACQDVITSTEGKPDPLLPITSGPENSSWDRWFQRVRSSRSNKWWASRGSDFS
ncbi:Guanine nucleotide-binding protein subunit gamma 2 [Dichanthelium oligosanthes]|uniref:Guanine nucleotide-binding protein subunit gamma 2 n=1 Tax=Dichanthelium oligosanthes TaxID=888268 RepID=A0A1E5VWA5_9POAL|nr:Guanine nucleotide-binding protein subunit gamma 2 [Dichanthelium oligosanthes]